MFCPVLPLDCVLYWVVDGQIAALLIYQYEMDTVRQYRIINWDIARIICLNVSESTTVADAWSVFMSSRVLPSTLKYDATPDTIDVYRKIGFTPNPHEIYDIVGPVDESVQETVQEYTFGTKTAVPYHIIARDPQGWSMPDLPIPLIMYL